MTTKAKKITSEEACVRILSKKPTYAIHRDSRYVYELSLEGYRTEKGRWCGDANTIPSTAEYYDFFDADPTEKKLPEAIEKCLAENSFGCNHDKVTKLCGALAEAFGK